MNVHTNSHMLQLTRRVIGIQQTPNTSYIIHTFNLSHRINNVVFCYKYKKHISVDPKISNHCKNIFGNFIGICILFNSYWICFQIFWNKLNITGKCCLLLWVSTSYLTHMYLCIVSTTVSINTISIDQQCVSTAI